MHNTPYSKPIRVFFMANSALELADEMLKHIESLMKQLEETEKERDEWENLCVEVHDAYKISLKNLESAREDLSKYRYKVIQLANEIENLKKSPQQHFLALSQDDLKRIRRYVHPDFTQKETGDLFRTVNGMIK